MSRQRSTRSCSHTPALSLALLLFFFQEGRSVGQILNREVVAVEVVRALVGSIGLIIAVPITTALAVAVVTDDAS